MGTHPIFESDFDCLTVNDMEARLPEFVELTGVNVEIGKKYMTRFDTFEEAQEVYLDTRDQSPVRKPDQPYAEGLIQSPQKCKKERVTKITVDKTQSFKNGTISRRFRPCKLAQAGTFDAVKKKAKYLDKKLLVSLYDESNVSCLEQNCSIWSSARFNAFGDRLLFYQLKIDSPEGVDFVQMYHSNDTALPHCALVDPRTGVLLSKWNEIDILDKLEHSLGGALNTTNRKRQLLIDQDEDEQIAIALAASMKQVKRRLIERNDSDVEYNSDFESICSEEEEVTFEGGIRIGKSNPTTPPPTQTPIEKSVDLGKA